ncbi:voltage-dependent calcium channel subunit alpha-2/delta-3-like [Xenia sp. Carnegie-2017]|uniref:voltage-dependent calcium channel subunit alpha-2/delta-3-like n=1 Tax=Xenia sp. Carnegie-2017 TaxID=2897299 RepID=UPI001F039E7B|nr:voltage-dependent calcium channel subunit alpha-2/delta-3-like [Xenia sp. Carnegie-2017]XP_046852880.1 voltage-dependent calcium channel subunit alpha-2/delta-3-like [Xenia sp. Carnegie-2017]XP_046852881.1 voltage-dependent calcium channel subunit alpha-2/delta-3-like [Xenia sp. Carnegie-2017]
MVIISARRLYMLLILAFLSCTFCSAYLDERKIRNLTRNVEAKINEFAIYATGSSFIKQSLANFSLTTKPINGQEMVKEIKEKIKAFFNTTTISLQRIASKAEDAYKNYQYDYNIQPFNYLDITDKHILSSYNLSYNSDFKMKITEEYSGVHVPIDIYDKATKIQNTIKWTEALDEVFKRNWHEEDGNIKSQSFGSSDGVYRLYPATEFHVKNDVDLFDVRKRPWYIHGSTSPKNVVILVDGSGSMNKITLIIAIEAVSELIDTLSENDFFNLIWFNIDVHYLACEGKLVQATSQNKKFFKAQLKNIRTKYVASWPKAYKAAFKLLEKEKGADCQKMISVFTDGSNNKAESVFKKYNSNNEVRLFTYAVGPPIHSVEALKSIACSNKGRFYRIQDIGSVRDVIKDYVTVLSRPMAKQSKRTPFWSSAYLDAGNLGMLITGAMPAFTRSNTTAHNVLLGVAGIDVSPEDLKNQSISVSLDNYGYLFFIDNNGHVILHPRFFTETGYLPDAPNIYLSEIEYSWNVNGTEPEKLRENILKTEDEIGNMSFDAALFSQSQEGHRVRKRRMSYYYANVKDSPIWAGIAFPSNLMNIIPKNDSMISKTLVDSLRNYWEQEPMTDVNRFVKTYDGDFNQSLSGWIFNLEEDIFGRLDGYPDDVTLFTVPYSSGKENTYEMNITGYRKMSVNASGTVVNVGVAGFVMNHAQFQKNYFFNSTTQGMEELCQLDDEEDAGFYCYLLDENAFVVATNLNSSATGQFFGKLNRAVMEQLVSGENTTIYTKITRNNPQGKCTDTVSSTSGAQFLQSFFSVTSYIRWCFAKAVWILANFNLYNWMYSGSSFVSAQTKGEQKNRRCIWEMTAYYSEIKDENMTKQGRVNCSCYSRYCQRSFVVSNVPKTNLYLVIVDGLCTASGNTKDVPGEPQEYKRTDNEEKELVCHEDKHRKPTSRCFKSTSQETDYKCGGSNDIKMSMLLLFKSFVTFLLFYVSK